MKPTNRWVLSLSISFALLTTASGQAPKASPSLDLTPVLVPATSGWRVNNYSGAKSDLTVALEDGRPFFKVGSSGLVLISKEKVTPDIELRVRFRMTSPDNKGTWLSLSAGLPKPEDQGLNPLRVFLQVHAGADPENVYWHLNPMPEKKDAVAGYYSIRNLPKNRLTWPDMVRRRMEADTAAEPRLTQRWITLRYQLRKNEVRSFLDDRLLRAGNHPKLDTTGFMNLTFQPGMEIASISLQPLSPPSPADARFETVVLDGYVNADKFRGDTVKLEGRGKPMSVGGVPFVLAQLDEKNQDHVDLKPSWLSCGAIEGDFYGGDSELPRWRGALVRERGRLQFRVANGAYTKLHLLAAFSGEPDTTPIVTAQFYRDNAGHPVNFEGKAPLFSASGQPHALPVALAGGAKVNLHVVTIPLDPNGPAAFSDLDHLEFELTKQVRTYRSFPDPINYSAHGAGLPSGVHVYGITLERPAVEVDFQPDAFAHIFTAPVKASYTARLKNITTAAQTVNLELATTSHDGQEKTVVKKSAQVAAGAEQAVPLPLELKKYGYHAVDLKIQTGGETHTQRRSLAHLHPDTRERGNWAEGKGPIFGLWDWNGGHGTVSGLPRLKAMVAAGMESSMASFTQLPPEEQKYLESVGGQSFFVAYQLAMTKDTLGGKEWDPTKPAEMQAALVKWLKAQKMATPSKINNPELAVFFAEPLLGPVSYMAQPEHFGEPPHQLTADEKAAYQRFLDQFVIGGAAIKKEWPNAKLLMPWGLPSFPIPFLRHSKEAREMMDGPALDVVLFERLPEMQIHQVTLSCCLWQLKQEWMKYGRPWPNFSTIEGPAISPARPGALTDQQEADHHVRAYMILGGYGTTRHLGWPVGFHCNGYWGETHYGSGLCDPLPLLSPRVVFSAHATMTRQINRMNFVKPVPTGSNTVFCYQFKHYKTGELLHVVWTLKGQRGVSVALPAGAKATVHDSMDNATELVEKAGQVTFTASSSPCYLRGLKEDARITLGAADHSDSQPAAERIELAQLGDGTWKLSAERDMAYEDSHSEFIRRFPGKFTIKPEAGDAKMGKTLAVHLEKQDKARKTMPFYTTLVPAKPIVIPGKPSHLGMWVKASSDWGRVVYCLKDAKGERWVSVGQKGEWNVDDVHCWSQFCFDGTRYLRFEMPANSPYDVYREMGTSFWGHYGQGDVVVDYPLTLEKIIVERRTHVIAGTEQAPASPDDVLLGGLCAEYETAADKTPEAVRLASLRMPLPTGLPELANPLKKLIDTGVGDGPAITKITMPEREYDGKRCHLHFQPQASAAKYDVWVSPYADGRGAVQLATGWTKPGELLTGLSANIDLYVYVVASDKTGKSTKPGPAYKINLKNMFPMQ